MSIPDDAVLLDWAQLHEDELSDTGYTLVLDGEPGQVELEVGEEFVEEWQERVE